MVKKIFGVKGMHCPNCSMQLESLEDKLPGIYRVEASYLHGTMKVEFDEAIVNENDIAEAASQMGYCLIIKSANN